MNIRRALEKNGFTVEKQSDGWDISQFTPAGEDWHIFLDKLVDFESYVEGFDAEEEFCNWVEARRAGVAGVPSPSELWKDQEWKVETLNKVLEDIE